MKYRKTELGRQLFKEHKQVLTGRQRSAFILMDGLKDHADVMKALAPTGLDADDIQHLVDAGLIEATDGGPSGSASTAKGVNSEAGQDGAQSDAGVKPVLTEQELYQRAYPVATKLTSGLGLRGFRLNLSVESASGYADLVALAPKIREAVGDEKFAELARALKGL
jgi:hypothetical protein